MTIPIALFFFVFFFYLRTHCASFNINDSGETIMVCELLTISHSPGYPLHTLWGKVNCLLPLGKPMLRVTLASILTGALSVVGLYLVMKMALKGFLQARTDEPSGGPSPGVWSSWTWEVPSLFTALIFAFSYQHWFQACGAKGGIYTLNTLLSVGMLYFFFKMRETGWYAKAFLMMGFLYGLSLAHHWPNQIVMAPAYFWFLMVGQRRIPLGDFFLWPPKPFLLVAQGFLFLFTWALLISPLFHKSLPQAFLLALILSLCLLAAMVIVRVFGVWHLMAVIGIFLFLFAYNQVSFRPPPTPPGVPIPSPSQLLPIGGTLFAVISLFLARIFGLAHYARSLMLGLTSLSVYLYLPLRSIHEPLVDWWNPETLGRLIGTVLREGYKGIGDIRSLVTIKRNLERFWLHAHHQFGDVFTFLVAALALWGLYWLFRKKGWTTAVGMGLFGGGVFSGVILFNNPLEGYQWTLDNFFSPVFLMAAVFAGAGLAGILEWAAREWTHRTVPLYLGTACLAFALAPLMLNYNAPEGRTKFGQAIYKSNDQFRYVSSYDEGMNMLKSVSRDAVILCNGDIDILPLWYLQHVEGKRPEVASFTMQLIPYDWYREPLFKRHPYLEVPVSPTDPRPETVVQAMIDKHRTLPHKDPKKQKEINEGKRAFYFTNIFTAPWVRDKNPSIPEGFVWRIVGTQGMDYPLTTEGVNAFWSTYRLRNLEPVDRGYWDEYTDVMKDSYGIGHDFTGYFAFMNKMPGLALWSFTNALRFRQPQTIARIHMMLGETHMAMGNYREATVSYQENLNRERNPYSCAKIGDAFRALGDLANAEAAYRAALSINPQQVEAAAGLKALGKELPNIQVPGQRNH